MESDSIRGIENLTDAEVKAVNEVIQSNGNETPISAVICAVTGRIVRVLDENQLYQDFQKRLTEMQEK